MNTDPKHVLSSFSRMCLELDLARSSALDIEAEILSLREKETRLSGVGAVFHSLINEEVYNGVSAVVDLQTEGLRSVFDDQDLFVKSEVSIQRGKVSVDLVTVQKNNGVEIEGSPNHSFGGSVTTVQSVLLRLTIMTRWGLRPFLVMDESLPALDQKYATNMGAFLSKLCKELGVDILLVSHDQTMIECADVAYKVVDGVDGPLFQRTK